MDDNFWLASFDIIGENGLEPVGAWVDDDAFFLGKILVENERPSQRSTGRRASLVVLVTIPSVLVSFRMININRIGLVEFYLTKF